MTRRGKYRSPRLLNAALLLGVLLLIGPPPFRASAEQPDRSLIGGMTHRGMRPWAGSGACPMGRQMPVVPYPEEELPSPTSQGATTFKRYCMQCHVLPSPKAHTAAEWNTSLERMVHRMRMMQREQTTPWGKWMPAIVAPSEADVAQLRGYLKENALNPAPQTLAPEKKGPGGVQFARVCSQCHALPDPALHTTKEWPGVVSRMHANMQRMGVAPPDEVARAQILAFLSEHARP